jgi:hypothetical protein
MKSLYQAAVMIALPPNQGNLKTGVAGFFLRMAIDA